MNTLPTARIRARTLLAALLALALALGMLPLSMAPASAAPGDYAVSITGPVTVPVKQGFTYEVTLDVDASPDDPASGIVLTTQLPVGVVFDSVPTGGASPVASYTWDAATRIVTFALKDMTEQLAAFAFSVTQDQNETKHEGTTFTTTITGSATPNGVEPSSSATTQVTGDNAYRPGKTFTVLTGSGNRVVTYYFNVYTAAGSSVAATFTSWAQRLTDVLPAGAIVQAQSDGWTQTSNPDGTTTMVYEQTGQYGPRGSGLDPTGLGIWFTVHYPEAAFAEGSPPPLNTVGLDTMDANGVWTSQPTASAQGPELMDGQQEAVYVIKGASFGLDNVNWGSGVWTSGYTVKASYINDLTSDQLESLTVTDAAADSADNAEFFDHFDVYRLRVVFNPVLTAADVPYTIEYTTNLNPAWQTFTPSSPTTGSAAAIRVDTAGTIGMSEGIYTELLELPLGAHLTGWRAVISPDAATSLPTGSEVTVETIGIASYTSLSGAGLADAPVVNTATASGVNTSGGSFEADDALQATITDRVNLFTAVTAPSTLTVGASANYVAAIANADPAGRIYDDAILRVVLPVGVFYDSAVGITPVTATTPTGRTIPQVGDGVTVSLETVTDAEGEHQVVVLQFDQLESIRTVGTVKQRNEGADAFRYNVPVLVQPQAYDPAGTSVTVVTWGTTEDPDYTTLPLGFWNGYYADDTFDFDPVRDRIARAGALSSVVTAGGLLIGKLVRAEGDTAWSPNATVATPGGSEWQVYVQNVLPNPVTDVVLFDLLPAVGDGRGSEFAVTLSGPVTGVPSGATVEYSTDATSADAGTWTSDPVGATAVRVLIPALTNGQSVTLVYPTAVPAGVEAALVATNGVSATGMYGGTERNFTSTLANISTSAVPSLTIDKVTNGVAYDAAPGAIVATGSDVVWTYTVTNTGNTYLDDVAISDAYVNGDGSTGTLVPTSADSGPLAPGGTRVFTATAAAVAGQYSNEATATATAVNADGEPLAQQPQPAADSSWYFAGDAGLTVDKLTNGEDVTEAPGVPLVPGSDVEWTYTVTNTGTLDLTDVLVTDVDMDGTVVFTEVIASLPAGESVTLSASGTAIVGQYENTVSVTAADPSGVVDEIATADTSWYFGVVSSISIDKSVSSAEQGPFDEQTTVQTGAGIWWQFVVTNTGNAPLTDVVITDTAVGDPIEIGDLEPGQIATIVIHQQGVQIGYTNVAIVTGIDPTGGEVTDDDEAAVAVTEPPTSSLPSTGLGMLWPLVGLAAVLLMIGAALVVRRRRRDAH